MKPAPFDYHRARDVDDAIVALRGHDGMARILAGGQSLVPMLNLRLASTPLLVDITDVEELKHSDRNDATVTLGACVTHAAIEDGRVADPSHGLMPRIARDIAYRAIRNRGTIGGSMALADPAAEWTVTLLALDAVILVRSESGARDIPAADFFLGAYTTALPEEAILTALRIPQLTRAARFGFYKVCRKTGEFATSLAIAVSDPERGVARVALGGTSGAPLRLAAVERLLSDLDRWDDRAADKLRAAADADLTASGRGFDADARQLHGITVMRAVREAVS
jgi:carbon-monoxide dehydrogenase medium subunit